ncbi:MAG: hypothetical protein ABI035_13650 [Gemmatimonadaceae bacterium]
MITASIAIGLLAALAQGPPSVDSVGTVQIQLPAATASTVGLPAPCNRAGPRDSPIGISLAYDVQTDAEFQADTTTRRPRAIEYSDAYYTRLRIHMVASYVELPLFGAEYILGDRLLRDERTGFPPSGLKAAHAGVAGGLGVLFAVNTVTGVWNLWDSRNDPANRTLRIIHSVAMLGADAGFALAGATGGNAQNSTLDAQRHRNIAVGSMALATAGTAIMWLFDK